LLLQKTRKTIMSIEDFEKTGFGLKKEIAEL